MLLMLASVNAFIIDICVSMIVLIGGDAIGSFGVYRRFVYYLFISMYTYLIDLPSQCMLINACLVLL